MQRECQQYSRPQPAPAILWIPLTPGFEQHAHTTRIRTAAQHWKLVCIEQQECHFQSTNSGWFGENKSRCEELTRDMCKRTTTIGVVNRVL